MNVCVYGLWHLGTVTAACLASAGHQVTGLDPDPRVVEDLARGVPPLFEPALENLVRSGLAGGRLRFTTDAPAAVRSADVVWVTFDTPVDDDDNADVDAVVNAIATLFPHLRDGSLVIVSSQVPVGTTRRLEQEFEQASAARHVRFAYSPENLRLGSAVDVFTRPDRVVAGIRSEQDARVISALLSAFTDRFEWMSVESAEMTKHALNAFLATSVTFINEVATLCERVGADAFEVQRGLKSDVRIGTRAYLSPGAAFAGGTLARDVMFLSRLGEQTGLATHLVSAVKTSNDTHRGWAERRLRDILGTVSGQRIAVWGLTYKPGTSTLRRSGAIELCRSLAAAGAHVVAHDPSARELPSDLRGILALATDPLAAASGATALVVATAWPEYRTIDAASVAERMSGNLVLDAGGFLAATFGQRQGVRYVRVGQAIQ